MVNESVQNTVAPAPLKREEKGDECYPIDSSLSFKEILKKKIGDVLTPEEMNIFFEELLNVIIFFFRCSLQIIFFRIGNEVISPPCEFRKFGTYGHFQQLINHHRPCRCTSNYKKSILLIATAI